MHLAAWRTITVVAVVIVIICAVVFVFTARKRSLGQGNIFRSVCQEFCPRGGGGGIPACLAGFQAHIQGGCLGGSGGGGLLVHSQGGSLGGSGPGPQPRAKFRGIWPGGYLLGGVTCSLIRGEGGCGDPPVTASAAALRILLECILVWWEVWFLLNSRKVEQDFLWLPSWTTHQCVKLLVEHGCNINHRDGQNRLGSNYIYYVLTYFCSYVAVCICKST